MVDRFVAAGFTYFDTAFGYNEGNQKLLPGSLVERLSPRVYQLATKLPAYEQTQPLKPGYVPTRLSAPGQDILLLLCTTLETHAFNKFYDTIYGILSASKKKRPVRHYWIFVHDKAERLDELLTRHPETDLFSAD